MVCDDSGDIKISAFGQLASTYFDAVDLGKIYIVSSAKVQLKNQEYDFLDHPCEIIVDRFTSVIESTHSESPPPPIIRYNPVTGFHTLRSMSDKSLAGKKQYFENLFIR